MASSSSQSPVEDTIREKMSLRLNKYCRALIQITAALQPSTLEIFNDSHLHAHHKAMEGVTSRETHFRLVITSEAFRSKMQPARHRLVYSLLKDEMAKEGGIHALQLRTMTPEEEEKRKLAESSA
ncbi:bola-like protein-domain-containing protein [Podospora aff. communis PSN243]|uniref:Bola-like protein-domain-containing protein n=1 Tax=Podospora aff. communis PSN243 TaxID=3040156 RepID=A0AAV9G6N7_9PEZI|nr:bola-like protein-domain-containing protein [Podospora aff. communis PSN243]